MTDRELMQMALDVLLQSETNPHAQVELAAQEDAAIEALRTRLAQPEPEPVIGTKTWFQDGKMITQDLHPSDVYLPNYLDRRQWKYDPMTGEPLVDGWPLYSGLPQPEQKPACWLYKGEAHLSARDLPPEETIPLYTAPPQREWQGLTDEEGYAIFEEARHGSDRPIGVLRGIRAIEAKLKEKNT